MKEIYLDEFTKIIDSHETAFLCGNGFSINFDSCFSNIYDRLFLSHTQVINHAKFDFAYSVPGNIRAIFKENYNGFMHYIKNFNETDLNYLFNDGVTYAQNIIADNSLIELLKENGLNYPLSFGTDMLDIVKSIAITGKYDFRYVNIEYWTILIYMYFAIKKIDDYYCLKLHANNMFVTAIEKGRCNRNPLIIDPEGEKDVFQYQISNGFTLYYRLLMCTAILCDGKAVDFDALEKKNLCIERIEKLLIRFKILLTLNYDHILEALSDKEIYHLHGSFLCDKKQYVYFHSLGLNLSEDSYIDFSNILIGDYFINKTFMGQINSMNKSPYCKTTFQPVSDTEKLLKRRKINAIFIMGIGISNDQHIFRAIMLAFADNCAQDYILVYGYYNEQDKISFKEEYDKLATFSSEVNEKVRQIKVMYINIKTVLGEYFEETK